MRCSVPPPCHTHLHSLTPLCRPERATTPKPATLVTAHVRSLSARSSLPRRAPTCPTWRAAPPLLTTQTSCMQPSWSSPHKQTRRSSTPPCRTGVCLGVEPDLKQMSLTLALFRDSSDLGWSTSFRVYLRIGSQVRSCRKLPRLFSSLSFLRPARVHRWH